MSIILRRVHGYTEVVILEYQQGSSVVGVSILPEKVDDPYVVSKALHHLADAIRKEMTDESS